MTRSRPRTVESLGALLLATAMLLASCAGAQQSPRWPGWGITHTQTSADHGDGAAIAAVHDALARQPMVQNQHIMGWGALNPEPSPDSYDFASLDRRMELITESGGIPVVTLCCAPDWMKGGAQGQTDWSELTTAPRPEFYADFAELSAEVAKRYPDVTRFIVWNEFKGFFDDDAGRWNAEGYTEMYNQVYDALKDVNPDIQVGGPYLDMAGPPDGSTRHDSALRGPWGTVDQRTLDAFGYWLDNKRGADFVVVDGHATEEGDDATGFDKLPKLSAVSRWVHERTDLPLWWAEWYVEPTDSGWSADKQRAVRTVAMMEMVRGGVQTSLYWNPEPTDADCGACLWTDTGEAGGGQPLPFLETIQNFIRWFPPGTTLTDVPASGPVEVLAQKQMVLVVNTTDSPVTTELDGRSVELSAYETRWVPRGPTTGTP